MESLSSRYRHIFEKYETIGQEHVFRFWDSLTAHEKKRLLDQAEKIDVKVVDEFKVLIRGENTALHYIPGTLKPFSVIRLPQSQEQYRAQARALAAGEQVLSQGKVGAILVAGGQGTRLGFPGPKGTFPVGPITDRTLFQYHVEKVLALERRYARAIPLYIMTSRSNYAQTIAFFESKRYFGRNKALFVFFQQRELPPLDLSGKLILDQKGIISTSPDGHGGLLNGIRDFRLIDDMEKRGVEILFYFQVDNVMVRVCDPVFLGYHVMAYAEMSAKTVRKRNAFEKLGNIGTIGNKTVTIEYTELSDEEKCAQKDGRLLFEQGSIAIHVFSRTFFKRLIDQAVELPFHLAHKKIAYIKTNGKRCKPRTENGIKFEQFIFDTVPYARTVTVMETDRDDFSPIKNKTKQDSPRTARQALTNMFASWLEECGVKIPKNKKGDVSVPIEISPLFAMNAGELRTKINPGKVRRPFLFTPGTTRG